MYDEVRSNLHQLMDIWIFIPSRSPFALIAVLVKKKSGALRMCVDYRKLNLQTTRDSYALPRIEELLEC